MYTLVQDGVDPLNQDQMESVIITVDTFMEESQHEGPIRFDHLVETMHDDVNDWSDDVGRQPTGLEIMAACCTLASRGRLRFDFIEGLQHVMWVPCE